MNLINLVKKLCLHYDFMPTEMYSFNGGDVYVRYEKEEKEEFYKFLKKLEDFWRLTDNNYSVISWSNLEIRIKVGA